MSEADVPAQVVVVHCTCHLTPPTAVHTCPIHSNLWRCPHCRPVQGEHLHTQAGEAGRKAHMRTVHPDIDPSSA